LPSPASAPTPIGIGVKAFWQGLREGALGVGPITRFDPASFACQVAAEVTLRAAEPGAAAPSRTD
jgi:3-oxoacyl-[acyl-carrier-protein] synthase II